MREMMGTGSRTMADLVPVAAARYREKPDLATPTSSTMCPPTIGSS